ncbi:hypothetical protein OAP65_01630 [Litorivicinus sp.]|nr:hypothetical protein [Litorivicinus sp.]
MGTEWVEPTEENRAGHGTFGRPKTDYDLFMESEGIPIYRDFGVQRCQDLPMKPWDRLGGNGTYVQLYGTEGTWGMYVVEIPPRKELNIERHIYEKNIMILEGRGVCEVWHDEKHKQVFEWQAGSLFSIPVNAYHRMINMSGQRVIFVAGTTAPNLMNLIGDRDFIFNCDYQFGSRFDDSLSDFFEEKTQIEPDPIRGLAMRRTNIMADIVHAELPLDNRRSPGFRRIEPHMTKNKFYMWIGQHEIGRYSKAHAHTSAAILFCLTGKGYTLTWPEHLGANPWKDGKGDEVVRVDYEYGGCVSAAPGGARWYHQHFNVSNEPFRLTAWFGPNHPSMLPGAAPGQKTTDYTAMDIHEGGTSIPYWMEDEYIRAEFQNQLEANGSVSRMEPHRYQKPDNIK